MKKLLQQAVTQDKDESWRFQCPGFVDSPCHDKDGNPFVSTGWPSKTVATARGTEHFTEHKTGADPDVDTVLMSDLDTFRRKHKLIPTADGKRAVASSVKDL